MMIQLYYNTLSYLTKAVYYTMLSLVIVLYLPLKRLLYKTLSYLTKAVYYTMLMLVIILYYPLIFMVLRGLITGVWVIPTP